MIKILEDDKHYFDNEYIDREIRYYRVNIFLPYYDGEEDMSHTYTTVEAISEDQARQLGQKYIKGKKTSKNGKIWKDAIIDSIEEIDK